ncbi:serine hydrolase domain-containing protein [Microlunatus soli]|uniref:CubicO group peptidase, beta-lactamase class C family n=1 Tax=Microlunatus soli TaxID=630515 RepID=A0A1H1MA95_9ACTN|nr:serine hydrolase domain-containing protein [Microlunatus soli]SDR83567.1 CubicO group peptidase, beta-lactamase class C family [Microlunatus soli]
MPNQTSVPALQRATPESQGLRSTAITAFLDAVAGRPELELHSVMIMRHGRLLAEGWWQPYGRDQLQLLYSLSKSFTSTAAGMAAAEGLLSLDDKIIDVFSEHADVAIDDRVRRLTLRHLVRMASGHREDALPAAYKADPDDLVRGFLQVPPDEEPGSIFAYNNVATFVVGAAVQKVSGQTLGAFLSDRLFAKIGIDRYFWQSDTQGRHLGFSGLHLSTESIARFGQLIIQGGRWNDEQLLDPEWLALATSKQTDNSGEANPDWRQGYGYQFWMARHGFRGDGAYGQFCLVLPEQDAVVAITSATGDLQGILDEVWGNLLPGFDDHELPDDHAAATALSDRLAALSLPAPGSAAWSAGPVPEPDRQPPAIRIDTIDEIGSDRVVLQLDHDHPEQPGRPVPVRPTAPLRLTCGLGQWIGGSVEVTDAAASAAMLDYAASGVRNADGSFDAEICFLQTPHRLRLRQAADGSTEAGWLTTPLMPASPEQLAIRAVAV